MGSFAGAWLKWPRLLVLIAAASAAFVVRFAAASSGVTCWDAEHLVCLAAVVGAGVAAVIVVSVAAN